MELVAVGSVIVDDIVLSGGETRMGVLGGGGTYAVCGMRVWCGGVGLVSAIGRGLPRSAEEHLEALADTTGVARLDAPQPRAWQLFEADGHRTEVFRTGFSSFEQMSPTPSDYPPAYAGAGGVFLLSGDVSKVRGWVERLRRDNPGVVVYWEPWDVFMEARNRPAFREVAHLVDVFSPNGVEAARLTGREDPFEQVQLLLEDGANVVALRLGENGSLVGTRGGDLWRVPAPRIPGVEVVDVTGAGNAYSGGFLAAWVATGGNALAAGRCGAVSATFVMEQFGPPMPGTLTSEEALRRLNYLNRLPW